MTKNPAACGIFARVQRTGLLAVFFWGSIVLAHEGVAQETRGRLPAVPRGVFCLEAASEPASQQVLSNPYVDGISIRQKWSDLEKSKGDYDWSFFDSEIARAEKAGKAVLVRILTEGPNTPQWVYDQGVQTFAYQDTNPYHGGGGSGMFALFWDKTYLAEKKAMIAAAGSHLSGDAAVKIIWAVLISSRSGDWHIPHTPADIEHWHAIGYAPEKLVDVCKQIIDTTVQSFPNQYVAMAVGPNGHLDPRPNFVGGKVVQYARSAYPDRVIFQRNSLSAVTRPPHSRGRYQFGELLENQPLVAGQMLWFTYGDPTCRNNGWQRPCDPEAVLRRAIDIGVSYRMRYIEIYHKDVVNLPSVIRYAHEVLTR